MPLDNIGLSFLPQQGGQENSQNPTSQLEDVIRILSFRLPRVLGAQSIAPQELLQSQGAAGDPLGGAIARAVLSSVTQAMPMGAQEPMGGGAGTSPLAQLLQGAIPGGGFGGPGGGVVSSAPPAPAPKPRVIPIPNQPSPEMPHGGTYAGGPQQQQRADQRDERLQGRTILSGRGLY